MNNPLIYCGLVALFWGGMSVVTRLSGLTGGWVAIMIATGTMAVSLVGVNSNIPTMKPLVVCLIAGILNGLGMLAFGKLASWQGIDVSKVVPIAFAMILIVITAGAWLLLDEPLTSSKFLGLIAVIIGIYLLG